MTPRERVLSALRLREPDRVPLDLGGTNSSSIIIPAYENLKKYLGLEHRTRLMAKRARIVFPEEALLQRLGIDTRALVLGNFSTAGQGEVDGEMFIDAWGVTWKRAPEGHFINVDGPFKQKDPKAEVLETFAWPDPNDAGLYTGLKEKALFLHQSTEYAVILNLPVGIVHQAQYMRGFAEYLEDLLVNPQFACGLMDRIADIWMKIAEKALETAGKHVDVIAFGDDLALQQSTFMSPETYRALIKPRHRRMIHTLKSRCEAKVRFHCCGSVFPLINDLIDIGVDALNPIQVSARHMEPRTLKMNFGNRLAFWGAIDTQRVLPFGTPKLVREEVRRIIDALGKGGGYILAAVHNIQAEVPPENIVAMFEEGRSYGSRPAGNPF